VPTIGKTHAQENGDEKSNGKEEPGRTQLTLGTFPSNVEYFRRGRIEGGGTLAHSKKEKKSKKGQSELCKDATRGAAVKYHEGRSVWGREKAQEKPGKISRSKGRGGVIAG